MDAIINVDQLTQWCVIVRLRGRNFATVNPCSRSMAILDRRVKRSDYGAEHELAEARRSLMREMLDAIFDGDGTWIDFVQSVNLSKEHPLSDIECLHVINNYTVGYLAVTGHEEEAMRLRANPTNLIAEDEAASAPPAAAAPAPDLPVGLHVGAAGDIRPVSPGEAGG